MPDLQSELNKILAAGQFDDDDGRKAPVVVTDSPKEVADTTDASNLRVRAWNFIKQNPGSTLGEIATALGSTTPSLAGGLHKMVQRGNLERTHHADGTGYHYTAKGDTYNVMSVEDRIALMQKARGQKRNVKAPKAVKKPKTKPIKWVQDKPKAPEPKAFDADEIIAGLTVLQAKELLVKLKEVFGV